MKKNRSVLIMVIIVSLFVMLGMVMSYQSSIRGTVVDAETGKPVEGAVALVEWTLTQGLGLTHTGSYKVSAVVTDHDGEFSAMGVVNPFVDPPHLTIYKKEYIAWNNEFIFPGFKEREDFRWTRKPVFKIERFMSKYSYTDHVTFIRTVIRSTIGYESKKKLLDAFDWETDLALKEVKQRGM